MLPIEFNALHGTTLNRNEFRVGIRKFQISFSLHSEETGRRRRNSLPFVLRHRKDGAVVAKSRQRVFGWSEPPPTPPPPSASLRKKYSARSSANFSRQNNKYLAVRRRCRFLFPRRRRSENNNPRTHASGLPTSRQEEEVFNFVGFCIIRDGDKRWRCAARCRFSHQVHGLDDEFNHLGECPSLDTTHTPSSNFNADLDAVL